MSYNYGATDSIDHQKNLSSLTQRIRNNLQNIRQITQSLNDIYSILGSPHDSSSRQDEIHKHEVKANNLLVLTKSLFDSMSQIGVIDQDSRVQINRVNEEYETVIKKYGETQTKIVTKLNQIVKEKRMSSMNDILVDTRELTESQSQTQIVENEEDLRLAEEVEQRVQQLEKDLINVQKMYTDINQMVVEEREKVDHIHGNVDEANVDVDEANSQLHSATNYKRKALKKKIIIIVVILILLAIIGIIIGVEVRKSK